MKKSFPIIIFIAYLFVLLIISIAHADIPSGNADLVLGQQDYLHRHPNHLDGNGINIPEDFAVDNNSGRVYIADTQNHRVLWWNDLASLITGQAADGVLGQSDLLSNLPNQGNLSCSAQTLYFPSGVQVDSSGNVWVADRSNSRILRFDAPITTGMSASIVLGQTNMTTRTYAISQNKMRYPSRIKLDNNGNLWVSDYNYHRTLRFDAPFTDGMNASIVLGQADFTSGSVNRGGSIAADTLSSPENIGIDLSGNIWVIDRGNNRALRYELPISSGMNASIVIGQADFVSGAANRGGTVNANTLSYPTGIKIESSGNLWITDRTNNRALCYAVPISSGMNATIVLGQSNFTTATANAGGLSAKSLYYPYNVDTDTSSNIWIIDTYNHRLLKYSSPISSGMDAVLELGQIDFIHNNPNSISQNAFNTMFGIEVDSATGRIFIADPSNNRVLWWDDLTTLITGQAADGVLGQADFTSNLANRGNASCSANTLYYPYDVKVDTSGNVWVADRNNYRILQFTPPLSNGMNATTVLGQANMTTRSYGCTQTKMRYPSYLTLDQNGNIWVSENTYNRALRFDAPFTNGKSASIVLGQANFTANSANRGGTTAADTLSAPNNIFVETSGNVWVCDSNNNRVLRYDSPISSGMPAGLVLGQADFIYGSINAGGSVSASGLRYPSGISMDGSGNIWVADKTNNRLLRYKAPISNGMAADSVIGQANFTAYTANRGQATCGVSSLYAPSDLTIDLSGTLWTADGTNYRLLKYEGVTNTITVSSITPGGSKQITPVTISDITGTGFGDGLVVKLRRIGQTDITATNVVVSDSNHLSCTFNLTNRTTGYWDVFVGSGTTGIPNGVLADGFLITSFFVSSATPNAEYNTAPVDVEISGAGFEPNSSVRLTRTGQTNIIASSITFVNSEKLNCTFDITGKAAGSWYIRVTTGGAGSYEYSLANSFTIKNLTLLTVDPAAAPNIFPTELTVTGTDFIPACTLVLTKAGEPDINGTSVQYIGPQTLKADFDISGKTKGTYSLTASTGGAGSASFTLSDCFEITETYVSSMTPVETTNIGSINAVIYGGHFETAYGCSLAKSGSQPIAGYNVVLVDSNTINCTFNIDSTDPGQWTLNLSTSNGTKLVAALANAVNIISKKNRSEIYLSKDQAGTITIEPNSGNISADISAGTFDQDTVITLSTDTVSASNQPSIRPLNIGFRLLNSAALQPLKPLTVTLNYRDSDAAGLDESNFSIALFHEDKSRWIVLPSQVYPQDNKVIASISHFSRYALVYLAPSEGLENVTVFPNPYNQTINSNGLTIENLPADAELKLFTFSRELVKTIEYTDKNGRAVWYGKNDSNNDVARGVYILFIRSSSGTRRIKVAVER